MATEPKPSEKTRKQEFIDALSVLFGGTGRASLFVVTVLGAGSLATWYAQYYLDSLDDPSSVILALPELDQNLIHVELDGHYKVETDNGFVRFDLLKPGKHSIAIFSNGRRIAYRQFKLASGVEIDLAFEDLVISSDDDSPVPPNSQISDVPSASDTLPEDTEQLVDVVIDPGHGGQDPGAIGVLADHQYLEKDLTLDFSKGLSDALNNRDITTALTRTDDRFMSLSRRVAFAGKTCDKLFISVHADRISDEKTHGASIYYMSDESRERAIIQIRAKRIAYGLADDEEMLSERFKENIDKARTIAQKLLTAIDISKSEKRISLHSKTPLSAGFIVLKASNGCPSLLIELGYISNKSDSARLVIPQYRRQYEEVIANAIANAL